MPDPDRLLITLRRAREAGRLGPRRGQTVWLPADADVLVAGDLHGNVENFRRLLALAALDRHPRRHLVLQELIHGPFRYAGGGDRSHQMVDLLAALAIQFPGRVHYLPGNHELAQATDRPVAKGDDVLNDLFWQGVWEAYGDRAPEVYGAYLDLFLDAPLAVRTAHRVFLSHSLPSGRHLETFDPAMLDREQVGPADRGPEGSVFALLWGRDLGAGHVAAFLRKVDADWLVTGHIPCDGGFETPNDRQLILDSAGYPAACCLLPAAPVSGLADLVSAVRML